MAAILYVVIASIVTRIKRTQIPLAARSVIQFMKILIIILSLLISSCVGFSQDGTGPRAQAGICLSTNQAQLFVPKGPRLGYGRGMRNGTGPRARMGLFPVQTNQVINIYNSNVIINSAPDQTVKTNKMVVVPCEWIERLTWESMLEQRRRAAFGQYLRRFEK